MDFSFVSKTLCIWFLSIVHVITGRRKTEKKIQLASCSIGSKAVKYTFIWASIPSCV